MVAALRIVLLALTVFAAIQAARTDWNAVWVAALFLGGLAIGLTSADVSTPPGAEPQPGPIARAVSR